MSEGLADRRLDQPYGLIGSDLLTPQIIDDHVSALAGKRQSNRATCAVRRQTAGGMIARSRERTHLGSGYPWRSVCLYVGQHPYSPDRTPA